MTTTTSSAPAPATAVTRRSDTRRKPPPGRTLNTTLRYVVLVLVAAIIVLPLVSIFLTSFKTDSEAIGNAGSPIPNPFTIQAVQPPANRQYPNFRRFLNSLAAGLLQTAVILIT